MIFLSLTVSLRHDAVPMKDHFHFIAHVNKRRIYGRRLNAFQSIAGKIYLRQSDNPHTFKSRALIATTIVLIDISTAPIAGLSTMPILNNTPAASGIAIAL